MISCSNPTSWDIYFVKMAQLVMTKSKDPSTQVGAVIVGPDNEVLSTGFNGFPRGVREHEPGYPDVLDQERWKRPQKYLWVEHAERNAILNAARVGTKLLGSKMYLNMEPCVCTDCAKAIIQCGIKSVVGPSIPFAGVGKGTHYDTHGVAPIMLEEAGVKIFVFDEIHLHKDSY